MATQEEKGSTSPAHDVVEQTEPGAAANLAPDVLLLIWDLLDPESLVSANQVCRAWRATLSTSAIPWRNACTRAHIDEWASGLGPRERVLRHVRTERAWTLGEVRSSSRVIRQTVERWNELVIDARTGLTGMFAVDSEEMTLVDTRTWATVHVFVAGADGGDAYLDDGVLVRRNRASATAYTVVRGPSSVDLVQVCTIPKTTDTAVMAMGTGHRVGAAIVELVTLDDERTFLRVRAPPGWTPHMVETDTHFISEDDLIPAFTETMLAFVQRDDTSLWPRRRSGQGGQEPVFPVWSTQGVGLGYRVHAGGQSARPRRPAFVQFIHVAPLVAGDNGFVDVVTPEEVEESRNVELPPPSFSGTDLLQVMPGRRGDTLLVVRDYAAAFDAIVKGGSVRPDQQAALRDRAIALRFDDRIHVIKAYGPRFAIAVGTDVVVLDTRRLPAMPLGHRQLPLPDLGLLVLRDAFPPQNGASMRMSYTKLAIDERAVYVFNAATRTMDVHAFGE